MKLQSLIDSLNETPAPAKTAAEKPAEKTAAPAMLDAAVSEVLAELETTKTASAADGPVAALTKLASEVAAVDRDGELKHASLMGAAFADGFVARLEQYQGAAEKVAAEEPSRAELEKQAEETYVATYNDTVREIHKVAAEHFVAGYEAVARAAQQG